MAFIEPALLTPSTRPSCLGRPDYCTQLYQEWKPGTGSTAIAWGPCSGHQPQHLAEAASTRGHLWYMTCSCPPCQLPDATCWLCTYAQASGACWSSLCFLGSHRPVQELFFLPDSLQPSLSSVQLPFLSLSQQHTAPYASFRSAHQSNSFYIYVGEDWIPRELYKERRCHTFGPST